MPKHFVGNLRFPFHILYHPYFLLFNSGSKTTQNEYDGEKTAKINALSERFHASSTVSSMWLIKKTFVK